ALHRVRSRESTTHVSDPQQMVGSRYGIEPIMSCFLFRWSPIMKKNLNKIWVYGFIENAFSILRIDVHGYFSESQSLYHFILNPSLIPHLTKYSLCHLILFTQGDSVQTSLAYLTLRITLFYVVKK